MLDYILYIFISIFFISFILLFKENFNKKYIPLIPRPKKGYSIRNKLIYAFVRSLFRSAFVALGSSLIYILFYSIGKGIFYLYPLVKAESINNSFKFKEIKELGIKGFDTLINLPDDTYNTSLFIASIFSIYAIVSFIIIFIKNIVLETIEKIGPYSEYKHKNTTLDKEISMIINPQNKDLNSFTYKKEFNYKSFNFFENVNHILSIYILWSIKDTESIHLYVLIISLLIISYSSMLRILAEYIHIIKRRLTIIHKIQIYIISAFIPTSTIILGFIFIEKGNYVPIYALIITSLISFTILNFGEVLNKKKKNIIKREIEENKKFMNFMRLFRDE